MRLVTTICVILAIGVIGRGIGAGFSGDITVGVITLLFLISVFWALMYFLFHIWPTPYRMERPSGHLVRIHRKTGITEILTPNGWQQITGPDSHSELPRNS